ncbi:MAG: ABC transporter ATP-binding protein [Proteobacteria bacterium]|nr:ABC transporter ATP-binding protein [Pseudomonadota bacterium]MBU1060281.1 ABC transporter ATP-binding protein [Pseudomonadota bacterium]
MPPAIELRHISKTFTERNWKTFLFRKPPSTKALDNISLTVDKGEIMGLLGPNGAGKTTLIKILATLVTPDEGSGSIAGNSLIEQTSAIRDKIGLVNTNDRTFYWRLTGRENLVFFATLYNLTGAVKKKQIEKVLELTEMQDQADLRFMSYSAGQKQRLSIARAMLSEPEILLLDEATSSLDPITTRKLLNFTKKTLARKEQKTIIWCTHNLHEADEICDRLTILHLGRILHSGSPESIKTLLNQKMRYALMVDTLHRNLEQQDDFELISKKNSSHLTCHIAILQKDIPLLLRTLSNDGVNVFECAPIDQPLETAFNELIARHSSSQRP